MNFMLQSSYHSISIEYAELLHSDDINDILKLSPSRICQLQEHIEKINEDFMKKGQKPAPKSIQLAQTLKTECEKSCYKKDSLDVLFPEIPDVDGVIKPDKDKVHYLYS